MSGGAASATRGNGRRGEDGGVCTGGIAQPLRSGRRACSAPNTEVAPPPLRPRSGAATSRPSARAPFRTGSHRPLFLARPSGASGSLLGLALSGRRRPPSVCPLPRPAPLPAHPAFAPPCTRWAAGPPARAAAPGLEPPRRLAPTLGLAPLLGLHLVSSKHAVHPCFSPAVLALQARKKRTKAKKDKAQRK